MKRISIILFLILLSGCSKNIKNPDNIEKDTAKNKYYCEEKTDCADCCTGECINYEWWQDNSRDSLWGECLCMPKNCACIENKCAKEG